MRVVIGTLSLWVATQAGTEENPWTLGKMFERSGAFLVPLKEVRLGPDAYGREWDFTKNDRGTSRSSTRWGTCRPPSKALLHSP